MSLPSERGQLTRLDELLENVRVKSEMPYEVFGRIELCLHEAVMNAIVHGNRESPQKTVGIELRWGNKEWSAVVSDQGTGFNPASVVDPTQEQNLLRTHGRGLFLMRELSDKLEYSEGGKTVTLTFRPKA